MNKESILNKTKAFLGQYIKNVDIAEDHDLFASGLFNSLFAMQLVLFVEKEFGLKVENQDLDYDNFKSLTAIVDFITQKIHPN